MVKNLLGHRYIESTEIYINLKEAIFDERDDKFNIGVVSETEEIKKLLEVGSEYNCEKDDLVFLRKRK